MKSIEERAKEYSKGHWDEPTAYEAYIAGAIEQKAIDEEVRLKKCDDMTEAEYNRETAFADWYLENGKGTPTYSPHFIVQQFKGYSSRILREEFAELRSRLPSLWTRSYFCESVGCISADTIIRYIENQKNH